MRVRTALMVMVILGMSACFFRAGPGDTIKSFHRHLEAGKLDSAMALLSKSTRSQIPEEKLKQGLQQTTQEINGRGGFKKIKVTSEEIIGETAEVEVLLIFEDGTEQKDENALIKEGGKWRIQPSSQSK